MGGNVGEVFGRLKEGVEKIEEKIPFSSDDRLGRWTYIDYSSNVKFNYINAIQYTICIYIYIVYSQIYIHNMYIHLHISLYVYTNININ